MSRAFLPIQPPHHACMNEGGRTGRNGGRMPANERRSRECRPAKQKKYQQTEGITPWCKETAGSTDTPLETKETIDDTSAILTNKKEFRQ